MILGEITAVHLVNLSVARDFLSKCIVPLTIFLIKLPDQSRNNEEKALLKTLCEAGLAVIRDSAREALNFDGKNEGRKQCE